MNDYHAFVPPPDHPRIQGLDSIDAFEYSKRLRNVEAVQKLFGPGTDLLKTPFYGVTSDGNKIGGLYSLQDENSPTADMATAASLVLELLSPEEKAKAVFDIDDEQWRKWFNPEIILYDVGIRLEKLSKEKSDSIMKLLEMSLSPEGYKKAKGALATNEFLGELCNARPILNQQSYFFMLFGTPSNTEPWAYTFTGHHLCLNFFVCGKQMVLSPFFTGAEPNIIDKGPLNGLEVLNLEGERGLSLMKSLSPVLQARARVYEHMKDPAMPEGRWHPADQRHMAGAFQDNRVIPYEGITASEMTSAQQESLLRIVATFYDILPAGPRHARLEQIRQHIDKTYFSWIGGFRDEDPFYYRIQSPVVLLEFDHHSGVFLTNEEPAKYHIHTIARTPNGNDYGRELLKLHRQKEAKAAI